MAAGAGTAEGAVPEVVPFPRPDPVVIEKDA